MAEFGIVGSNNDMHLGSSQSHSFRGDSLCTYNGTDQTRQTLIFNANDFNFHLDSTRRLLYRRNKIPPSRMERKPRDRFRRRGVGRPD